VIDTSVAMELPIKLYSLIFIIVLVSILVILIGIRFKDTNRKWNNVISLIIALALIPPAVVLATHEEPQYYFEPTYDFEVLIVSSSGDFDVDDYWIKADKEESYIYKSDNGSVIYGLSDREFESVEIQYNNTPIFWGNNSILFEIYHDYNKFIIYYQNTSGEYVLHVLEEELYDNPIEFYFEYGASWIEIEITIHMGPVV
jgi:hypothetical protein